jgi:hypothetical protein
MDAPRLPKMLRNDAVYLVEVKEKGPDFGDWQAERLQSGKYIVKAMRQRSKKRGKL